MLPFACSGREVREGEVVLGCKADGKGASAEPLLLPSFSEVDRIGIRGSKETLVEE